MGRVARCVELDSVCCAHAEKRRENDTFIPMIDLRSDTVTRPTDAMRQAMAHAEVGDDVFGEDPTVNALEEMTASLLGKEAAMFVPSGTMANQLAVRLHTQGGDEVLLEAGAHVLGNEAGAAAALSGVTCRTIAGRRGIFTADDLLAALRPPNVHHPPTRLVCVENTHNVGGGSVWPIETLAQLSQAAKSRGLAFHMDGARLWNASVASGIPERDYASHCDTVSVCYSKGLGAPVGSALVGPRQTIDRARRFRKMLGGGSVWPIETLAQLSQAARSRGLAFHMDGARLWNASVASGIPERDYSSHCDTVSVCYSKGLGAPVGSALAGPREAINRARRFRKMLGGGMRQAGILAAGALYALNHHRQRLKDDHANARLLAEGLLQIPRVSIDDPIETNIVRFRIGSNRAAEVAQTLKQRGVLILPVGPDRFRAVTHLMIRPADIRAAVQAIQSAVCELD